MPYTLISGDLIIARLGRPSEGPEPDGDTVRFAPRVPALVDQLPRQDVAPDWRTIDGVRQLNVRLEAIDTLETHFQGSHQPLDLGFGARDRLIELLGFRDVTFLDTNPNKVRTAVPHPIPGWILSNGLDGNGRVIAFVATGEAPGPDGARLFVTPDQLSDTVNVTLLREGHAYPALYTSLPAELRDALAPMALRARAERAGLWATAAGDPVRPAPVGDLAALERAVIWPKLYRRLQQFFASGRSDLGLFDGWLRANGDDRILLLDHGIPGRLRPGELGNLHDLVTVHAATGSVALALFPEQFVVIEGTAVPSTPPVPQPLSPVRIVAAVVNPVGADQGRETVTVLNTGVDAVDLDGWTITDAAGSRRHRLPAQALGAGDALRTTLAAVQLNNEGDTILLLGPGDELADRVTYGRVDATTPGRSVLFAAR